MISYDCVLYTTVPHNNLKVVPHNITSKQSVMAVPHNSISQQSYGNATQQYLTTVLWWRHTTVLHTSLMAAPYTSISQQSLMVAPHNSISSQSLQTVSYPPGSRFCHSLWWERRLRWTPAPLSAARTTCSLKTQRSEHWSWGMTVSASLLKRPQWCTLLYLAAYTHPAKWVWANYAVQA